MRIHTNLTSTEMNTLTYGIDGVYGEWTEHGSRSRARAFDLHLVADQRKGRRRSNSGSYGAGYDYAATWDEWGIVFARLFALDPEARCGSGRNVTYDGIEDYHFKTASRFRAFGRLVQLAASGRWVFPDSVPFETHDQHRFRWNRAQSEQDTELLDDGRQVHTSWCNCGALRRYVWTPREAVSA